nr:rna binding protein musashi [Hymenolepis microstoma]
MRIYFSQYGEVEEASVMIDNRTGRSRGFGYVKFRDQKSVNRVLATKPHWLDEKEIDTQQCNVNMKGRNRRNLKIFVGGIGMDQDAASIKSYFEKFGHVTDVNLLIDPVKQKHRGFAFIGFEDEKTVNRLINMHFLTIGNKKVEIKAMEPPNYNQKSNPNSELSNPELCLLKDSGIKSASHSVKANKPQSKQIIVKLDSNLPRFASISKANSPTKTDPSLQLSIPGNFNSMPWIYSNGYFPICPHFCPGCHPYPYHTLQPGLNPGYFPGSCMNFWIHGVCSEQQQQQQQEYVPPPSLSKQQIGLLGDPPSLFGQVSTESNSIEKRQSPIQAKPSGDNFDLEGIKTKLAEQNFSQLISPIPAYNCMSQYLPPCSFRYPFQECQMYPQPPFSHFSPSNVYNTQNQDLNVGAFEYEVSSDQKEEDIDHEAFFSSLMKDHSDLRLTNYSISESKTKTERKIMASGDRVTDIFKDFDL